MAGATKLMTAGGGGVSLTPASSIASDVTVNVPSVNGTLVSTGSTAQVSQAMLASGVAGNGPAFAASDTATTATSAVTTKIVYDTEIFDTNSSWDGSKFLPLVAGYYQINATVQPGGTTNIGTVNVQIWKNGSAYIVSTAYYAAGYAPRPSISAVVYLNGSTDYIEIYGTNNGNANLGVSQVSGCLVRAE